MLHCLHLPLLLLRRAFHRVKGKFRLSDPFQQALRFLLCLSVSVPHVELQFPVGVASEQQRADLLASGDVPDVAAAIEGRGDECLVLLD